MFAVTHVIVEPNLTLCSRTFGAKNVKLFHPCHLQQQCNFILHALMQLDTTRLMKGLYHHPRVRYGNTEFGSDGQQHQQQQLAPLRALELQLDLVSSETMSALPRAHHDHNHSGDDETEQVVAGKRYREFAPGLNPNATDILAFADPLVKRLLRDHGGVVTTQKKNQQKNDVVDNEEDQLFHLLLEDHFDPEFLIRGGSPSSSLSSIGRTLSCGDLVLCPGQMLAALGRDSRRCNQVGTMEEYLVCALTHSILHLFGYDHSTVEERDAMLVMEKKVARCVVEWTRNN